MKTGAIVRWSLIVVFVIVAFLDSGSILIAKFAVSEDAADVGRAATIAVKGDPITPVYAQEAYDAAAIVATERQEVVRKEDFVLNKNGSVTFTLTREAPTLVVSRVGFLKKYASLSYTTTAFPPTV